jgi:hypothetical protein
MYSRQSVSGSLREPVIHQGVSFVIVRCMIKQRVSGSLREPVTHQGVLFISARYMVECQSQAPSGSLSYTRVFIY